MLDYSGIFIKLSKINNRIIKFIFISFYYYISWCVLHPAREEAYHYDRHNPVECERFALFTSIHHRALFAVSSLKKNTLNQHVIAAQDLEEIIEKLVERLRAPLATVSKASYIFAAGRLFEVIQSTTAANCIYGNKRELTNINCIINYTFIFVSFV